jgi:arginase
LARFCDQLAREVCRALREHQRVCVLGGDHSCAIGTWSGAQQALGDKGPLGLVWVDAHMDSHTPATSPSGALHGMPLACLLGHGPAALAGLAGSKPKLTPQHVCLVGVRSFEPAEAALLRRLGVRVFYMDEVHRRGFARVMHDALTYVQKNTAAFGVSIDLDAIDPRDAPGVGSPVEAGICGKDLAELLSHVGRHPRLLGLEIAEFNPHKDVDNRTAERVIDLLAATVGLRG